MTIFQCPVCRLPLEVTARQYHCENGHLFDRAREGYVNLLLANQKKSKEPGDSREMIRARKAFLARGHYQQLAETVVIVMASHLSASSVTLDAGCGEGYYTDYIGRHSDNTLYGIDISKDAVRYAAKLNKQIPFAVASVASLPVQANSADAVLSIFAPRDADEMQRVLKPGGILITVTPAPDHLLQLRHMIYDDIRPYTMMDTDTFAPQFTHRDSRIVNYDITLTGSDEIAALLQMTPFYWHSPSDKRDELLALTDLTLKIAFEVTVWRSTNAE